jgi:hypothetical protein
VKQSIALLPPELMDRAEQEFTTLLVRLADEDARYVDTV